MNDNLKRYCAILRALRQVLGHHAGTHKDRHLITQAALISGLVGSGKAQLPAIAAKCQVGGKVQSRHKRYARWLKNERITPQTSFFPFAQALLQSLQGQTLTFIMDGSEVGRGCLALMVALVYEGRALPLAWTVVVGKKGHFKQEVHIQLIEQVRLLIAAEAAGEHNDIVFLGDGEFDGVELLGCLEEMGWKYACRTARNVLVSSSCCVPMPLYEHTDRFGLCPGRGVTYPDQWFTAQEYGPVQIGAVWEPGHGEPIFLVTNWGTIEEAHKWYKKRFRIETFFSDQKSRGFRIRESHLSDPARLNRLLIVSCLAYYWIVCLGQQVVRHGWVRIIHRNSRCDLSLFRLGMEWLQHCLNEGKELPVYFTHQT